MLRLVVVLLVGFAALGFVSVADAATVVPVAGDSYVRSDYPTSNFGSQTQLQVDGSPVRTALLYFPNTPSGVTAATLRVYSTWHTGQPLNVRQISCAGWSEGTVTYSSYQAVQKGPVVATIPNDPVGWLSVTIPADKVNAGFGGTSSNANCFAVEKPGDLWMNLAARETAGDGAQLVVATTTPAPTPTGSPVSSCSGTPVDAYPSTIGSVISGHNNVVINAHPGTYSNLSMHKTTSDSCVAIRCTVSAKTSTGGANPNGCLVAGQTNIESIRNLTIEGFVIKETGADTYGIAIYDESPHVGAYSRIANNVFDDSTDHDISTKERNAYTEVIGNVFLHCRRHCWEIGQNPNLPSRPSTTNTAVFKNNIVYSSINGLTQRYNLNLDVEDNDFRNADGHAIMNWPFWATYAGQYNMVPGTYCTVSTSFCTPSESTPYVPLRTVIKNNHFAGNANLLFVSRGVLNDSVLLQGNTGTITGCLRAYMDYWDSGTAAAHSNEQTTRAPLLDSASDRACPSV